MYKNIFSPPFREYIFIFFVAQPPFYDSAVFFIHFFLQCFVFLLFVKFIIFDDLGLENLKVFT